MGRHQAFDLEIVGASTFPELIGTIFRTLPVVSELDGVTLSLVDEGDDILVVMEKLGVDFSVFPQMLFVHQPGELGFMPAAEGAPPLPLLGPFDAAVHGARFPASATLRLPAQRGAGALAAQQAADRQPEPGQQRCHALYAGAGHRLHQAHGVDYRDLPGKRDQQ